MLSNPLITGLTFMISGKIMPEPRTVLFLLLLCLTQNANADFSLDALMAQFSKTTYGNAQFREEKQMAVLETPLILEGTLSYRAPDYLRKEVQQPEHSLFEITGDLLRIETETEQQTLSLDTHPLIRAFAESYRATLSGDGVMLRQYFETELTGTLDNWTLRLLPKDDQVRSHIKVIFIMGSGNQIYSTKTVEVTGDFSVMTIEPDNE